jgi:hypothetical protein
MSSHKQQPDPSKFCILKFDSFPLVGPAGRAAAGARWGGHNRPKRRNAEFRVVGFLWNRKVLLSKLMLSAIKHVTGTNTINFQRQHDSSPAQNDLLQHGATDCIAHNM